jgi:tetratricopeptide (TPR) repeat protein
MAEQLQVFVSHSHEDDSFCRAVVQALREAGADVWYDEHNMGSGQLLDTIDRELRERPMFILILTPAAVKSAWVRDECKWAYNLLRRDPSRLILPVTAAPGVEEHQLPLYLQDFKRIEAPGLAPYPPEEAARRLVRTLGLTPRGEAPTPLAPQPTESVDDLLARGKALNAQDKYAEALSIFERVTQLASSSFDAWANLGLARNETGRHGDDVQAYDRALALNDTQAWIWNNKGKAFYELQRYEEALDAYDRSLALDPSDAFAWNGKGTTLWQLKRYTDAVTAHDRALALDPTYAKAWISKAFSLRALGRTSEAEAAEKRARELGWKG